jgi:hypothetical protein
LAKVGDALRLNWDRQLAEREDRVMATQSKVVSGGELLEADEGALRERLGRKLREYEARYELASERVREEVEGGRLRETAEVCDWLVAIETVQALDRAG